MNIKSQKEKGVLLEINGGVFCYATDYNWKLQISLLSIHTNKVTAIVGTSGCGKTTLLKILLGELELQGGKLRTNDNQVASPILGYVSQENSLLPWLTVYENIRWGQRNIVKGHAEEIDELLISTKLVNHRNKYPDELSGGLKRRVMLTRALAMKPSLLLLDEPFAGLDIPSRDSLISLFIEIMATQNLTIVWVTHDVEDLALLANMVYLISGSGTVLPTPFNNSKVLGPAMRSSVESAKFSRDIINQLIELSI